MYFSEKKYSCYTLEKKLKIKKKTLGKTSGEEFQTAQAYAYSLLF